MPRWLVTLIASATLLIALSACGVGPGLIPTSTPGTNSPTATPLPSVSAPEWVLELIAGFEQDEVANPPLSVSEYEYGGRTVYFVPQRCCDIYSDLYDADGNLIAHPDGGITGSGDGRAADFFEVAELVRVVWTDPRDPEQEYVQAPIVDARVIPQEESGYGLRVTSALPDGCHTFAGWEIADGPLATDQVLNVTVRNLHPVSTEVACTDVYRTMEFTVPLPYDFEPGETYAIRVNEVTVDFTADGDQADWQAALDEARARWDAAETDEYTALFQWSCFCLRENAALVRLTVQDDVIVDAHYAEAAMEGSPELERYLTVPGLFALIQEAIDQGAYRISAQYDASLGYPAEVWIDYNAMMADEERGFTLELEPAAN